MAQEGQSIDTAMKGAVRHVLTRFSLTETEIHSNTNMNVSLI